MRKFGPSEFVRGPKERWSSKPHLEGAPHGHRNEGVTNENNLTAGRLLHCQRR